MTHMTDLPGHFFHEPMQIWMFHEAPEALQALAEHGSDEDWLGAPYPAGADEQRGETA